MGILAIRDAPADMCQKREHAPVTIAAHFDAWAQTNPEPVAHPEVAPFLDGPAAMEAVVRRRR